MSRRGENDINIMASAAHDPCTHARTHQPSHRSTGLICGRLNPKNPNHVSEELNEGWARGGAVLEDSQPVDIKKGEQITSNVCFVLL